MCGIWAALVPNADRERAWRDAKPCLEAIRKRGPDAFNTAEIPVPGTDTCLLLAVAVLHLRGQSPVVQPLRDPDSGSVLCWNGEVFGGLAVDEKAGDTPAVLSAVLKGNVRETLASVCGPFAVVFYDADRRQLWFGRDRLGRRSLLDLSGDGWFQVCSVAPPDAPFAANARPIPAGVFCLSPATWAVGAARGGLGLGLTSPAVTPAPPPGVPQQLGAVLSPAYAAAVDVLLVQLESAVLKRLAAPSGRDSAQTAILFSGGLDCAVLARLADRLLPPNEPIDLLSVAFENPRKARVETPFEGAPDRQTARATWQDLLRISPQRPWRLVLVNVTFAEYEAAKTRVMALVRPHATVLDYSIAVAFYFAASGRGICAETGRPCVSTARVLLSGLGADEQLGGYSRHRSAFSSGGWARLEREISHDISRISTRNLGRDDRVVSAHAREVRYPFLDEDIVAILAALPVHIKCDPRLDRGQGEKLLLRLLARERLALENASALPKRAIQFGARTAKMGSSKERGHDTLVYQLG